MSRKSPKCPPIVEPNQSGCVWNFSAMFDHDRHHGGLPNNRKLLSDVSHVTDTAPRSQEIMLSFDEQLRGINMEATRTTTAADSRERSLNKFSVKETSLSKHTKKNKEVKRDPSTDIHAYDDGFCSQIPQKVEKGSRSRKTGKKHDQFDEKNPSFLDEKPGYSMEVWKKSTKKSFWEAIRSQNEQTDNEKKNLRFVERIVVLKPAQYPVGSPVDIGCGCSNLQSHHRSTSKQQIVKHTRFSFNDIRKRLKNTRKLKNTKETFDEVSESGSQGLSLSIVPYTKEPDVFVEARRHLAQRLREISKGEASSSKQASRTLERILLSSPKHGSKASLTPKHEETHWRLSVCNGSEGGCGRSLQTWKDDPLSDSGHPQRNCGTETKDTGDLKPSVAEGSRLEFSLDVSSPKSDCKFKLETMDNDQFKGENPSPVSVLESYFVDNVGSPTSTTDSIEHHIQPHRLDFEDHSQTSSPSLQKTSLRTSMEDKDFISAYVKKVIQASQLNWDEFLTMECPEESSFEYRLLHDCIKEVFISSHQCYLEFSPFKRSKLQHFSLEEHVVNEVTENVNWHTSPPMIPRTLDQLVRRDLAKAGKWVDVNLNSKEIVFEVVDETLQELVMEMIFDVQS